VREGGTLVILMLNCLATTSGRPKSLQSQIHGDYFKTRLTLASYHGDIVLRLLLHALCHNTEFAFRFVVTAKYDECKKSRIRQKKWDARYAVFDQ
jgi:hypothetical protein